MTSNLSLILFFAIVIATRWPRIRERWVAPLIRGTEWFFDVPVPPGFLDGSGRAILRDYRLRLFIPWAIEVPILAAILVAGQRLYVYPLIFVITLFTRFNYYAARIAAENRARRFETSGVAETVSAVVLSLEPRRLASYTRRWIEATIILITAAFLSWAAYLAATSASPQMPRILFRIAIVHVYIQAGLLLVKREVIRSGGAAPADNAEQYLAWRDSLRRFTTGMCDTIRLQMCLVPLLAMAFTEGGQGLWAVTTLVSVVTCVIAFRYEWRSRRAYLEVVRRTRPAKLPALPGVEKAGLLCFWPSLPMLLLKTANGYALNLASAPVRFGGLYLAGFAGLLVWLR